MELSYKRSVDFTKRNVTDFIADNQEYFEMYRVRAWICSVFTPFIAFVPVYLWIAAFDEFSGASVIQFVISIVLFLTWTCIPGAFLYVNSKHHIVAKIWLWVWPGLMVTAIVLWAIWFS
ncbi:hypothetical protein [Pseudalkalibacillus decolorationis]|uniref:hypothetical protein n=1 Tax=Pseudalkalibacillus decolorationis TaxID=163879 RepID=UPI0021496969|nr:hypothetical protein [Pseudalkalibacillus decolorationis]